MGAGRYERKNNSLLAGHCSLHSVENDRFKEFATFAVPYPSGVDSPDAIRALRPGDGPTQSTVIGISGAIPTLISTAAHAFPTLLFPRKFHDAASGGVDSHIIAKEHKDSRGRMNRGKSSAGRIGLFSMRHRYAMREEKSAFEEGRRLESRPRGTAEEACHGWTPNRQGSFISLV